LDSFPIGLAGWALRVDLGHAGAGLAKALAVAVHLEDMDVVGQPVEQGAYQALGFEGFGPLFEGQV